MGHLEAKELSGKRIGSLSVLAINKSIEGAGVVGQRHGHSFKFIGAQQEQNIKSEGKKRWLMGVPCINI